MVYRLTRLKRSILVSRSFKKTAEQMSNYWHVYVTVIVKSTPLPRNLKITELVASLI